jgi:hypothetical protein
MNSYEKFSHARRQKFTARAKGISAILLGFLLSVASPALPTETFDMLLNPELYPFPRYSFTSHFHHSIQVKVNKDTSSYDGHIDESNPNNHLKTSSWSEPIAVMVGKVLERELLLSNLFDSVSRDDDRSSLVLEIDLNFFSAGWERGSSGFRPILTLYGAVNLNASLRSRRDGKILLLKNYRENTRAETNGFRHTEKHAAVEAGNALKKALLSIVHDVKHRMESVEIEPDRGEKELISAKEIPQRRRKSPSGESRKTAKQPPEKKTTVEKQAPKAKSTGGKQVPKRETASRKNHRRKVPQKAPIPVVLDPIGPK